MFFSEGVYAKNVFCQLVKTFLCMWLLAIQFFPFYERIAKTDLLILKSEDHQLFGRFSGTIEIDTGKTIQFKDIVG